MFYLLVFEKETVTLLVELKDKLKEIQNIRSDAILVSCPDIPSLPIRDLNGLQEIEVWLTVDQNMAALVSITFQIISKWYWLKVCVTVLKIKLRKLNVGETDWMLLDNGLLWGFIPL